MCSPIAPGAHIELYGAIWRVQRLDPTSIGTQAWRCIGVSEIVRDQEAVFLEEYEPDVRVLDPRKTQLVRDTSSQHRAGLLGLSGWWTSWILPRWVSRSFHDSWFSRCPPASLKRSVTPSGYSAHLGLIARQLHS